MAIANVVGVGVGTVNVIGVPEDEAATFGASTLSSLGASVNVEPTLSLGAPVNVKAALGDSSAFT
jgi:hypothetical protein